MKQILIALPLVLVTACSSSDKVSHDSSAVASAGVDKRSEWITALKDSVDSLHTAYESTLSQSEQARTEFESLLSHFEIKTDPMLVEKYRVVKGWKDYDTTGKQGIISRVLEDGTIEIVATSGSDFNHISLSNGSESVQTAPVSSGDALHVTINGLTRVAFNNAGNIAEFVYQHSDEPLTLTFSNGKTFSLSQAQKNMIADTYEFSLNEKRMSELDRQKTVIFNKLLLCQDKLAELEQTK